MPPRSTRSEGWASRCFRVGKQRVAAGQKLAVARPLEQLGRFAEGRRTMVFERVHGRPPYSAACGIGLSWIARQTFSAVAGIETPDPDRVGDRIDHRRRRADRAGLAAALHAQRVVGAGRLGQRDLEARHVVRLGHGVVHVGRRQQLAVLVVDAVLEQGLADALDDAAVDLTLDDHRVDRHCRSRRPRRTGRSGPRRCRGRPRPRRRRRRPDR